MPVFDRAEDATFFAKYFSQFISNGVFPNPSTNMQVLATEGMRVKVGIGVCYINGYMGWVEPAEILELEESDLQSRIDRIVARLDFTDRSIKLFVKKGVAVGNPVAPELQRDYDIYEIGLADIYVGANVIDIFQENITDLRLNTELCGVVANHLQHVDTTTLFNQYQDWLRRVTKEAEEDLAEKRAQFVVYFENMKKLFSDEFNDWFSGVKNTLDGDIAGNLYNLIQTKADKKKKWTITADTNWTGTSAPYTKTIAVEGMLATYIPKLYPIYSETLATREAEREAYNMINLIKSSDNAIELICDEDKPTTALNLRVEVDF